MSDELEDSTVYVAIVTEHEQYSIWPAELELPMGWREAGKRGPRAEVIAWIEEVWGDMQPRS